MNEIDRLLGAVEKLLAAEAIALRGADVATAAEIQGRIGPLIHRLAEVLRTGLSGAYRPAHLAERVHRLQENRRRNVQYLAELRKDREEALARLQTARGRLRELKPAYGAPSRRAPSFSAAG